MIQMLLQALKIFYQIQTVNLDYTIVSKQKLKVFAVKSPDSLDYNY